MLLARRDESRHRMSIDGFIGHKGLLTVAILSTTSLNFSNVLRNEEIQSLPTTAIGLSVPLTADAMLWTGPTTKFISEMAFFADSRATFTVVTSVVSCYTRCSGYGLDGNITERTLGVSASGGSVLTYWGGGGRFIWRLHSDGRRRGSRRLAGISFWNTVLLLGEVDLLRPVTQKPCIPFQNV